MKINFTVSEIWINLLIGPALTLSLSQNWNVSYKIFHQAANSSATTSFLLMCKEDYHFVEQEATFEAVCGWDGYYFHKKMRYIFCAMCAVYFDQQIHVFVPVRVVQILNISW